MRKSRELIKSKKMRSLLSFFKSVKIREKSSTMKWKKLFLGTTMRKMSLMISFLTVVSIFAVFYLMSINNQIDETILQANEYLEIEEEYRLVMSDIKQVISIQYDMMATGYTSQKQTHIDRIFANASNWEQAKQFLISEGLEAYVKQIEESRVSLFQLHQDYFQSYHSNWSEIVNRNISPIITPIDSHLTRIDNNITAHIREIIELNNHQVTQTLHESTIRTMILIAILFSIPAISMFLFAKDLNKGVSQLKAQMGKYENGDFYISRVTNRFDEMGELENSLEKMRSKIAENLTENKFISNKIVVTANEIENERKELSVKNEEMEEVIQKQQLLVQHQLQNAHSISAVTEESSASTLEIHHSLEELKKGMETMNLYASKGTTYITETEQNIDKVTNLMDFFLTQLEQVKENTNAIQRFMKHIFEISNQTNLLAINASIEAARAGTHGNGFKVVAQEVQNLSKQTNTFSVEIANQLSLINENVTISLNGFTELHQSIKQTKELSQTTSTQFKEVSSQSDKMLMQVFDVTSTMEEISKGTLEIVSSINDLADQSNVSEESVIVIKDISQSQSQATDILQRSVNELSLLAVKLQNQEERFSKST